MTTAVSLIDTASDTFQVLVDRLNMMANLMSNAMVTVSQTSGGSTTTGNAVVNGMVQANTLVIQTALRGGTLALPGTLAISTNVNIGSGAVNIGTNGLISSNNRVTVGNSAIDLNRITVGNSTANVFVNASAVSIGGSNAATVANRSAVGALENSKLNFVAGANVTITVSNDAAGGQINVQINAVPQTVSIPGGSNTYVQVNDSGTLTGFVGMTFDKTSNNFSVANTVTAAAVQIGGVVKSAVNISTAGTTAQLVDSWSASTYRTAFYNYSVKNGSANGFQVGQIALLYDGSDSQMSEYGVFTTNTSVGTFAANVSGTTVRLYFTPVPLAANVRLDKTLLAL